jgi:tRNA uridine 5-carbamoylmethylation protein Kti12
MNANPQVSALVIRGPSGVGKSTVAHQLAALLRERFIAHAVIDMDEVARIFPSPGGEPWLTNLATRNVAALWMNYRAMGACRLIIVGVLEFLDSDLSGLRQSVRDAQFSVVRLRANSTALQERLLRRNSAAGLREHVNRSIAVGMRMDGEPIGACNVVETTGRGVADVATDILIASGWI